ncbi:unnamed protein product [Heterosigma akashiwo]
MNPKKALLNKAAMMMASLQQQQQRENQGSEPGLAEQQAALQAVNSVGGGENEGPSAPDGQIEGTVVSAKDPKDGAAPAGLGVAAAENVGDGSAVRNVEAGEGESSRGTNHQQVAASMETERAADDEDGEDAGNAVSSAASLLPLL